MASITIYSCEYSTFIRNKIDKNAVKYNNITTAYSSPQIINQTSSPI